MSGVDWHTQNEPVQSLLHHLDQIMESYLNNVHGQRDVTLTRRHIMDTMLCSGLLFVHTVLGGAASTHCTGSQTGDTPTGETQTGDAQTGDTQTDR